LFYKFSDTNFWYGYGAVAYDLNRDNYVCYKWAGGNGGYTFTDDISNS
jgi:hypothetical protein